MDVLLGTLSCLQAGCVALVAVARSHTGTIQIHLAFLKHLISFAWALEELSLSSVTLYLRHLEKGCSRGDGAHIF